MLVGPDNVCKIANFSIAQDPDSDEEFLPEANRFAVKWSAPEVVSRAQFSTPGDVWSYGILLTELVTYGRAPYPGMNNAEVLQQVERGYRMPSPPGTPEPLYKIMLDCWAAVRRLTEIGAPTSEKRDQGGEEPGRFLRRQACR